jgi:single-strand DNA-binding protein
MINKVFLAGNITREPELRQTSGGMAVLSFGLAVNDRRKNQQTGEWEDVPNFFDMTMFGKRAEGVSRCLRKGSKVSVEAKARWHSWQAQDGTKRSKVDFLVDEIELMSQKGSLGNEPVYQAAQPAQQAAPVQPRLAEVPAQAPSIYDEDIPF